MDLLLWRHAEAAEGRPDLERALTSRGRAQARAMAGWLGSRLPVGTRILVSPARRARETADPLGLAFEISEAIAPGLDAAALIRAAGWPDAGRPVLAVGHQPTLGEVAAALLTGNRDRPLEKRGQSPFRIAKGAVWWLRRRSRGDTVLVLAIEPALLAPSQ